MAGMTNAGPLRAKFDKGGAFLTLKKKIMGFWSERPCGVAFTTCRWGTREFFREIERHRYKMYPEFKTLFESIDWCGKRILEVGCGVGTDSRYITRLGGDVTAVDLAPNAVKLTKRGFRLMALDGNQIICDAENLPLKKESFDIVYSWGVLHHTERPRKAFREIYRVLKGGGEALVILYNRISWKYIYIIVINGILRGRLLQKTPEQLITQATEGKGNPLTRMFSRGEVYQQFSHFDEVKTAAFYFDFPEYIHPLLGKYFPRKLRNLLGRTFGSFREVFAYKS